MYRKLRILVTLSAIAMIFTLLMSPQPVNAKRGGSGGRGDGPVIYVTGQNLVYDSIVTADPLPPHGRFQKLVPGGPTGLQTEFGPGDHGYVGGRWWLDQNNNGEMDPPGEDGDKYFSCPLLGPGRTP